MGDSPWCSNRECLLRLRLLSDIQIRFQQSLLKSLLNNEIIFSLSLSNRPQVALDPEKLAGSTLEVKLSKTCEDIWKFVQCDLFSDFFILLFFFTVMTIHISYMRRKKSIIHCVPYIELLFQGKNTSNLNRGDPSRTKRSLYTPKGNRYHRSHQLSIPQAFNHAFSSNDFF